MRAGLRNLVFAVGALGCTALVPSSASATPSICDALAGNLVQNCGFELPALPSGLPPDWSTFGSEMSVTNAAPNSGTQNLEFGAFPPDLDVLSQTLGTTAGTTYNIDFYYHFSGDPTSGLTVTWDGTTLFSETNHAPLAGYTLLSFTALGTGSDTLEFDAYDARSFDYLDDVSVVASQVVTGVPEPLTLSLFGAGLAGVAAMRRRKKVVA